MINIDSLRIELPGFTLQDINLSIGDGVLRSLAQQGLAKLLKNSWFSSDSRLLLNAPYNILAAVKNSGYSLRSLSNEVHAWGATQIF
ncbi:MAG: hypothetical protein JRC89_10705 [Deltaproteobacteria bacterium]|nr:hypothetical protein [Deltaproteobacteria bacterium]